MKLEKITQKSGRRYHDACGAAHGLDLVGERWALLVMRELMMGPRRFGDLKKDLHGVSANVLTQRLEGLEATALEELGMTPDFLVDHYGPHLPVPDADAAGPWSTRLSGFLDIGCARQGRIGLSPTARRARSTRQEIA